MNKLLVASIAAFIGAALSVEYLYEWRMAIDLYQSAYWFWVLIFAVGALANVVYWYGLSIVGTKYHNATLHTMALLALALSILSDASNAVFTLLPHYAASPAWGAFNFLMGTLFAIAFILTGLAMQRLRPQFGDTALWYGIGAMLSGVLALIGDTGISYIGMLGVALNAILYVLGGMILFRAAKK